MAQDNTVQAIAAQENTSVGDAVYTLEVRHLIRNYTMGDPDGNSVEIKVLKDLSFGVEEGEFVGIMGRSGCGKTTLLKVLGLIDEPTEGSILYKGEATEYLFGDRLAEIRRNKLGFIFQDFYLLDSLNIRENIMLPLILDEAEVPVMKEAAMQYAEHFGISHLLDKSPHELSGGEKQRAAICRALINDPDLILADEPTGNLDSKSGKIVVSAMEEINEKLGKTIIMVTHDPQMASHCKRIIFLKDGVILEDLRRDGTPDEFYQEILGRMKEL